MSALRYRYRPPTRPCITRRRYPHLPTATAAAAAVAIQGAVRPKFCPVCSGFHLEPIPGDDAVVNVPARDEGQVDMRSQRRTAA